MEAPAHSDLVVLTKADLRSLMEEAAATGARQAIHAAQGLKPLMDIKDVARTLQVSPKTFERKHQSALPPMWVGGLKRWHPDTVDAYIRTQANKIR